MLCRIKLYIIVQMLQLEHSVTCIQQNSKMNHSLSPIHEIRMKERLGCCGSIVHLYKEKPVFSSSATELGGGGLHQWYTRPAYLSGNAAQNGERLGTLILMSPMLMLRGISGRFMFFTAETARAGAADRPPSDFSMRFCTST